MMKVASSWSGGKDSCFACYKAKEDGYEIKYLVNFVSEEYNRVSFHGTSAGVVKTQGDMVGIPIFQKLVNRTNYEEKFKEAMREIKDKGIEGVVFGDIDLEEHKAWVEKACSDVGLIAIEPLWQKRQKDILNEFVEKGFQAVMSSVNSKFFDESWAGRIIDKDCIHDFERMEKEKGLTVCGELGEYHTLVVNGPLFKNRLNVTKGIKVFRDGFWFQDMVLPRGGTVITATQDLHIVPEISDTAIVLGEDKNIKRFGNVCDLLKDREFLEENNLIHVHAHTHKGSIHVHPHGYPDHHHSHPE